MTNQFLPTNQNFIINHFNYCHQDQLSAICATPPHLEGATLQEIPMESLNCDGNVNQNKNANVFHQLELRSRQNNLTFVRKFSEGVSEFKWIKKFLT